ncbi:hemagglutinin [Serratia quinivorans]|uniref:Hemagglutinin n=1 Tax=Serratia quinivorans TaxID=137545 RepID=A0ABV3ULG0_9GAMM|nr:hemagglutinin [Serratia quinivorans]
MLHARRESLHSAISLVFATEKLSEQEIFEYAQSLTAGKTLTEIPTAPGRFYAKLDDGSIVNLRSFSESSDKTKARWTIDIIGNEKLNALQGKVKKRTEIKFR